MSDCLLITGGTGFIGRRLIPTLRSTSLDRRIIVLVRDVTRASSLSEAGVELVQGDVTRPRLGLADRDYAKLSSEATQIVHGAGEINFGAPLHIARAANVYGTQQIVS